MRLLPKAGWDGGDTDESLAPFLLVPMMATSPGAVFLLGGVVVSSSLIPPVGDSPGESHETAALKHRVLLGGVTLELHHSFLVTTGLLVQLWSVLVPAPSASSFWFVTSRQKLVSMYAPPKRHTADLCDKEVRRGSKALPFKLCCGGVKAWLRWRL